MRVGEDTSYGPFVAKLRLGELEPATQRPCMRLSDKSARAQNKIHLQQAEDLGQPGQLYHTESGPTQSNLLHPGGSSGGGVPRGDPRSADMFPGGNISRHMFSARNAIVHERLNIASRRPGYRRGCA